METICKFCEEKDETSIHVLGQCPKLVQTRFSRLGEYLILDATMKYLEVGSITPLPGRSAISLGSTLLLVIWFLSKRYPIEQIQGNTVCFLYECCMWGFQKSKILYRWEFDSLKVIHNDKSVLVQNCRHISVQNCLKKVENYLEKQSMYTTIRCLLRQWDSCDYKSKQISFGKWDWHVKVLIELQNYKNQSRCIWFCLQTRKKSKSKNWNSFTR